MDIDRNPQTGKASRGLGRDYYVYFYLTGDNSLSYATLNKWNSTSNSWKNIKSLMPNARLAPGLSHMEIWVDKQDIGYTQNGIDFYIVSDSYVKAIPGAELTYVIGSSVKQITVDGEPGDWSSIAPLVTFRYRSINPPEFEVSNVYVANDDENLYFKLDTRGKPTTSINEGELYRAFDVYLDTDNNDNTGYILEGGVEFEVVAYFNANISKYTGEIYEKYNGTGRDWSWHEIEGPRNPSDFNSVFEFKTPLRLLGLGSGQKVGIRIESIFWWGLERYIPNFGHLTYPPDTTPPVTAIAFGEPKHQVGSTTYVSGSTTFKLSASDDASGVKETRYRIDGGPWTTYSAGFPLPTLPDGEHTISYYSIDNAGNNETEKTLTIILDKTPPTISDASPTGTIGSTSVTFTVKVEDSGSGVKEVKLTVDGASQGLMSQSGSTYTKTLSLSEGSHTWVVEAVDNVGNTAIQKYSFTISTWMSLLPYLTAIAIVIVIIIATAAIMLRRRRVQKPP